MQQTSLVTNIDLILVRYIQQSLFVEFKEQEGHQR